MDNIPSPFFSSRFAFSLASGSFILCDAGSC